MSNISIHHVWEAQLEGGRWEPYPEHTQLVLEAGLVDDAAPATPPSPPALHRSTCRVRAAPPLLLNGFPESRPEPNRC